MPTNFPVSAAVLETKNHAHKITTAEELVDKKLICGVGHVKKCIEINENLDFLKQLVKNIPDPPKEIDVITVGEKPVRKRSRKSLADGVLDDEPASPKIRKPRAKKMAIVISDSNSDDQSAANSPETAHVSTKSRSSVFSILNTNDEEPLTGPLSHSSSPLITSSPMMTIPTYNRPLPSALSPKLIQKPGISPLVTSHVISHAELYATSQRPQLQTITHLPTTAPPPLTPLATTAPKIAVAAPAIQEDDDYDDV